MADNGYSGKVSFSGFGENLLNPDFVEIVSIFHYHLPQATLECNTNGDKLDVDYLKTLFNESRIEFIVHQFVR